MIHKWQWYKRDNPHRGVHVLKNNAPCGGKAVLSPRSVHYFSIHSGFVVDYSLLAMLEGTAPNLATCTESNRVPSEHALTSPQNLRVSLNFMWIFYPCEFWYIRHWFMSIHIFSDEIIYFSFYYSTISDLCIVRFAVRSKPCMPRTTYCTVQYAYTHRFSPNRKIYERVYDYSGTAIRVAQSGSCCPKIERG